MRKNCVQNPFAQGFFRIDFMDWNSVSVNARFRTDTYDTQSTLRGMEEKGSHSSMEIG